MIDGFIKGADVSSLLEVEEAGGRFFDESCRDGSQPSASFRSDEACRDGSQPSAALRSEQATGNRQQAAGQGSGIKDQGSGDGGDGFFAALRMTEGDGGTDSSALLRCAQNDSGGMSLSTALDDTQLAALRALLAGEDPGPMLRARRVMPSLLADAVNEALLDEFGDTVLDCDGDRLSLVEDYAAELSRLLEENEA